MYVLKQVSEYRVLIILLWEGEVMCPCPQMMSILSWARKEAAEGMIWVTGIQQRVRWATETAK